MILQTIESELIQALIDGGNSFHGLLKFEEPECTSKHR